MGSLCLVTLSEMIPPDRSFFSGYIHFLIIGKLTSESGTLLFLDIGLIVLSTYNKLLNARNGNRSITG